MGRKGRKERMGKGAAWPVHRLAMVCLTLDACERGHGAKEAKEQLPMRVRMRLRMRVRMRLCLSASLEDGSKGTSADENQPQDTHQKGYH